MKEPKKNPDGRWKDTLCYHSYKSIRPASFRVPKQICVECDSDDRRYRGVPDHDADGSWDAHQCQVEECEWCEENPCACTEGP